jgi:hypothetical protein
MSAVAGLLDGLRARLRSLTRAQVVIGGLTLAINVGIVLMLVYESHFGVVKPPAFIAYFKSWEDGRSRAEAEEVQEEERRLQAEAERIAAELDVGAPEASAATE